MRRGEGFPGTNDLEEDALMRERDEVIRAVFFRA